MGYMNTLVCAAVLATVCEAQTPAPASLSGKITDSITHQPIAGVQVKLGSDSLRTGADGTYRFADLVPATRVLFLSHPDYATLADGIFPAVALHAGESVVRDFDLSPIASIRIRLLDRDTGEPIPGMLAGLLRPNRRSGTLPSTFEASTKMPGQFGFTGLPGGTYILWIHPKPREFDARQTSTTPAPTGYATEFYPSGSSIDTAAPLTVLPGEDRVIDWRIGKRELHEAAATINPGKEYDSAEVEFFVAQDKMLYLHGSLAKPGPLRLPGLFRGTWRLVVRSTGEPLENRVFGETEFTVGDHDVDDLKVSLERGGSVRAEIRMAEEKTNPPAQLKFSISPVVTNWAFTPDTVPMGVRAVPSGEYRPLLAGLPKGFAIAARLVNGRDSARNIPIHIAAGADTVVTYVVTGRPGFLAGSVKDRDGKPAAGAHVLVAPDPQPKDYYDPTMPVVTTDAGGNFAFENIVPGLYRAALLTGNDERWRSDAVIVEIEAGKTATAQLVAIETR